MSLEANIHVPGLLSVVYPFRGQTITSHVRLAGSVVIDKEKLPEGTQYIVNQLPQGTDPLSVFTSHALRGKTYYISSVSYYIDGTIYREIDYTDDEINAYQFDKDFLPVWFGGEELSVGEHTLTIQIFGFSFENPGIQIFDIIDLPFIYDQSSISIFDYLQSITPQLFLGEIDWTLMIRALDYVLTQRSEGALKTDIDFLDSLYDIDSLPDVLLPYLSKTVGYEYFTGISGRNQDAVRQELRFLPDWQKSVGTEQSILVLLRSLNLEAELIPLYLDMAQNILVPGVNRYFRAEDQDLLRPGFRGQRFFTGFSHPNFLPNTVVTQMLVGNVKVLEILWSPIQNKPVISYYDPLNDWLDADWNSPAPTNAQELMDSGVIDRIDISQQRGGLTIFFSELVGVNERIRIQSTYQIARDTRPGRNHRLSEFFDVDIISREPPNRVSAGNFLRVLNIIQKSKPFRTKLRTIGFPVSLADIYHVNATSVSSTGSLGNLDIAERHNISNLGVNLRFPMREQVGFTVYNRPIDGFTFTWENDCDRWENRFGIFHSLAIEPELHGGAVRRLIQSDGLMRRGYAVRVENDALERAPDQDTRERVLRRVDLEIKNFKNRDTRCIVKEDHEVFWHKFFLEGDPDPDMNAEWEYPSPLTGTISVSGSRALNTAVTELDSPDPITIDNTVVHHFRVLDINTPGEFIQLNVTFDGSINALVEWEGITSPTIEEMTLVPQDPDIPVQKASEDYLLIIDHPTNPQVFIILRFTAFDTEESVKYLYTVSPSFNNMPFKHGGDESPYVPYWYAFATVITDPWETPVQWSATFQSVRANFQDVSCCEDLGTIASGGSLNIDETLDDSYRYNVHHSIQLVAVEDATGDIKDILRWNGAYWVPSEEASALTWDMQPTDNDTDTWGTFPGAASPELPAVTNPVQVQGTVTYPAGTPGAGVQESTYTIKLCARKAGERLVYTIAPVFADFWSLGRLHRGEYSPYDRQDTFYGGHKARDLVDLRHDKYIDAAAMDDVYFRADDAQTTPQIHPSLRYTLTPPAPLEQMKWDEVGHVFDGQYFWDVSPLLASRHIHINHFPRKTVFQTVESFDIANVEATTPD